MTDDELLSQRLARAIGHCTAEFARANPTVSTRAVLAAYVFNLCVLGEKAGTLEGCLTAIRDTWTEPRPADPTMLSQARPPPGEPDARGS